jgi:hypothetical protein
VVKSVYGSIFHAALSGREEGLFAQGAASKESSALSKEVSANTDEGKRKKQMKIIRNIIHSSPKTERNAYSVLSFFAFFAPFARDIIFTPEISSPD